jgi:uncharacterized protein
MQTRLTEKKPDLQSRIDELLEQTKHFARKHFNNSQVSHAWDHTIRVYRLCEKIGNKEGADLPVLLAAAYLHDIGRSSQDDANGNVCHAQAGARMARPFVYELPLSRSRQDNILHCIESHRFRGNHRPETIEARVLFDADKLDAIGAIGIARAYLFAGEVGARLHTSDIKIEEARPYSENDTGYREYRVKLCKIRDRMLTAEGRRLADARHAFMEDFFMRFIKEYEGKG